MLTTRNRFHKWGVETDTRHCRSLSAGGGRLGLLFVILLCLPGCFLNVESAREGFPCNPDASCLEGLVCIDGICVVDPCADVSCVEGLVCALGTCHLQSCEDRVCPEGLLCLDGDCVTPTCVGVTCETEHACADGRCYPTACVHMDCGAGVCVDGQCVPRSCVGVTCPEGEACGLGECHPVDCTSPCAQGEVCVGGVCTEASCVGIRCGDGQLCGRGLCWSVMCEDEDCGPGEVCVNGTCTAMPCVGVICPDGQTCEDGVCDDPLLCDGEVCVEPPVEQGGLGQPCFPNDTCDNPFLCDAEVCVEPPVEQGGLGQPCFPNDTCDDPLLCSLEGTCIADETGCEPDLLSDSFESADMSATNTDGFQWGNNNRTSIVTMDPGPLAVWNNGPTSNPGPEGADWTALDGDYSLRFRYPAGESQAEQRFDMGAPQTEIWIRYWLRVPTNFRHDRPAPTNNKFFALWMDDYAQHGEGPTIWWNFWREGDTDSSRFTYNIGETGSSDGGHHSAFPFFIRSPEDQGRWMQVVLYARMSTNAESMDGESRIYRRWEGEDAFTLIGETTNKNFSAPTNGPNGWKAGYIMGWSNPTYEETTEWLLDKFELSTGSLLCD